MKEKDEIEHLNKSFKVIKIKLVLFFVFEFVMMLVYIYFLCVFCSVYSASQWNWFTNSFTSVGLSMLQSFGTSLIISGFRFIGLYCKSEKTYNVSLYLNRG